MHRHDEEDDEADLDDREEPNPEDADWNMEPAEVSCPYCRREIPEDAGRCPYCGNYILEQEQARSRPWWWIVAVVLLILLLVRYLIRY